jgi:hypothetical protein
MGTIFVDNLEPQSGTSLTLGASGDTLTIPSGCTISNSGTAAGFGKIGQVVSNEYTSATSTSSSSFTQIGPSVAITPSATTSKILINVAGGALYTATDKKIDMTIYRDSSNLGGSNGMMAHFANSSFLQSPMSMTILDSPSTTSSTTYAVYVRTTTGSSVDVQAANYKSVLTAMEVLA